jgi:RNA polymerase sigma-70 factor, ECF subfamily
MYCNISQFDPQRGTFKTWLFSIVHHECYRIQNRILKRYFRLNEEKLNSIDKEILLSADESNKEVSIDISSLLQTLPEQYRLPIILTKIEQFSIVEAAQILDLSSANVKQRVYRGFQLLRKYLDNEITQERHHELQRNGR